MASNLENIRPPKRSDFPNFTDSGFRYLQELARWVNNNAGWVNRSSIAANDFGLTDLTPDGNWYPLDLSAIVPDQARAVFLKLGVQSGPTVDHSFRIRPIGETTNFAALEQVTQITQVYNYAFGIVELTRDAQVEYRGENTADWDSITITVMGWFI